MTAPGQLHGSEWAVKLRCCLLISDLLFSSALCCHHLAAAVPLADSLPITFLLFDLWLCPHVPVVLSESLKRGLSFSSSCFRAALVSKTAAQTGSAGANECGKKAGT